MTGDMSFPVGAGGVVIRPGPRTLTLNDNPFGCWCNASASGGVEGDEGLGCLDFPGHALGRVTKASLWDCDTMDH